jgi:prepilin-type N-terminal cleavage/methylation domain-containing protein
MLSNRKGFTLIELLIVVVIIGILAAIAIPKFANTKEKAYIAAMKSDLKNLSTAQEGYFSDAQTYGGTVTQVNFTESTGVNIAISGNTATGWTATATHDAVTGKSCTITVGSGANEGEPICS